MNAAPVLEMRGIVKTFPGVRALDGVDVTLHAGDVHMLLGENGAGKSTLMKILSGAYRKDSGEILCDGRRVEIAGPRDALAHGIRVIYQELTLVPQLSIAENIFLGHVPTSAIGTIDRAALRARTAGVLGELGLDAGALDPGMRVSRLGIAQQQMVEIAKALAHGDARVLVMDEPTSSLTAREVGQLFSLIDRLTARGVSVVYITHRLDEVFRIGRRITVLRDGRCVATGAIGGVSVAELVRLMANRDVAEHYPRARTEAGAELLRLERVSSAGRVSDVSFSVRAGEVVGVAGLVGAGRTELARVIAGADPHDGGRILVRGRAVKIATPADAIASGIVLLPEDRKAHGLVGGLTAVRNIALPHVRRIARVGIVTRRSEQQLANPIVKDLRIKAAPAQPVRVLSGGNQQKVVLGKWLGGRASVFIFDEPTRGIDVGAKVEIYNLMNRLTARGAAIVMISSELPELLGMSDRILVMHRGRVQAELDRAEATEERVLTAALGLAS